MATSELQFAVKPSLTPSELDDVGALVAEARWNQLAADWRIFLELGRVYAAHHRRRPHRRHHRDAALRRAFRLDQHGAGEGRLPSPRSGDPADAPGDGRTRARGSHPHPRCHARRPRRLSQARLRRLLGLCAADPPRAATRRRYLRQVRRTSPYGRSPTRIGRRCAPTMPRLSAPIAAPCLRACAGGCPRPSSSPSAPAASSGFALGRDGGLAAQIGPLIADDAAIAAALLARALDGLEGPLFVDLADSKRRCASFLDRAASPRCGRSRACCMGLRRASTTRRAPSP